MTERERFEANVGLKIVVLGYALKALGGDINVAAINKFGRVEVPMTKTNIRELLSEMRDEVEDMVPDVYLGDEDDEDDK